MLKAIFLVTAAVVVTLIVFQSSLSDGSLLNYLKSHPEQRTTAPMLYFAGQVEVFKENYAAAVPYFQEVISKHADSSLCENALYSWAETEDKGQLMSHLNLVGEYQRYLDKFPEGRFAGLATMRRDTYRNGG